MTHPFMAAVADGLEQRGVATLRFQFPYMEAGSKRPDRPPLAHASVRAAVDVAERLGLPLFAGGKSFGARMTSQAQAEAPLPHVRGLVFFGFPLHPANKPSDERARHLAGVRVPMLFLQGTRDALAETRSAGADGGGVGRGLDAETGRACRSFVPRSGAVGPDGRSGSGRGPRRSGRVDADGLERPTRDSPVTANRRAEAIAPVALPRRSGNLRRMMFAPQNLPVAVRAVLCPAPLYRGPALSG